MSDIDQLLTQIPLAAIAQELGVDESPGRGILAHGA
jgi:hypothetical protein